jgi:hypothetical protein
MKSASPIEMNRVGRFEISYQLLRTLPQSSLALIFSHFIIVRAEALYNKYVIEYTAYSEMFETIPLGSEPFWYEITVVNGGDSILAVCGNRKAVWTPGIIKEA